LSTCNFINTPLIKFRLVIKIKFKNEAKVWKPLTSSTSQTNKNTSIGIMNIHERGIPPKRSERNADPRSAGSVHDPERYIYKICSTKWTHNSLIIKLIWSYQSAFNIRLLYPLAWEFLPRRKGFFPVKTPFFPWEGKKCLSSGKKPNPVRI